MTTDTSSREAGSRASPSVLLYDGDCGFCSRSVLFAFARDPLGKIHYASLQSEVGRALLAKHGVPLDMTTVVLVDEKGAHVRSTAVLRTARLLKWPWSWGYAAIYRWVARHRHKFGPAVEACRMPTPELRARMLDR